MSAAEQGAVVHPHDPFVEETPLIVVRARRPMRPLEFFAELAAIQAKLEAMAAMPDEERGNIDENLEWLFGHGNARTLLASAGLEIELLSSADVEEAS